MPPQGTIQKGPLADMTFEEYRQRRYLKDHIKHVMNYSRAHLEGFPVDIQCEQYGDLTRIVTTVRFVLQPELPRIIMPVVTADVKPLVVTSEAR